VLSTILSTRALQVFSFAIGDVLLFSKWTFHRTQPWQHAACGENKPGPDKDSSTAEEPCLEAGKPSRFVLVGRFTSGEAAFGYVPGVSSQKKHTCQHNLSTGDALHSACFPQLMPQPLTDEVDRLESGVLKTISNDWRMAQVLAHLAHEAVYGSDHRLIDALAHIFLSGSGLCTTLVLVLVLARVLRPAS
jgi:hypothetical protein